MLRTDSEGRPIVQHVEEEQDVHLITAAQLAAVYRLAKAARALARTRSPSTSQRRRVLRAAREIGEA